jgi:Ca2+-binding RTX toxin-like protein
MPTGNSGNNTLKGKVGVKDFFYGFSGKDTFIGNGEGEHDTADYSLDGKFGAKHGVMVNLSDEVKQGIPPKTGIDSFGFKDSLKGIEDVIGTRFSDTLCGNRHDNVLNGLSGNDLLIGARGNDTVLGGQGNDSLFGGEGADNLFGGTGADTFGFQDIGHTTVDPSGRDTISDFRRAQKDKIGLKQIDANTGTAGDDFFTFIGTADFGNTAGQLRYEATEGGVVVQGDVNGDGKADFAIFVKGVAALKAGDFYL